MKPSKWERRIQRAEELARTYPCASEVLHFYKKLAALQQALYAGATIKHNGDRKSVPGSLHIELELDLMIRDFHRFLSALETIAPPPLAHAAKDLQSDGNGISADVLRRTCSQMSEFQPRAEPPATVLARLFLLPFAENLADHSGPLPLASASRLCPFCSSKPSVGVLRPEGDGGKRFLICSTCSTEWAYGRILCAACGEEAVQKLPVYTSPSLKHVRIESCDTCRHYIKTIDLTKNGLAVPVVDELATIPLDLWANEQGYVKLQANLLGL